MRARDRDHPLARALHHRVLDLARAVAQGARDLIGRLECSYSASGIERALEMAREDRNQALKIRRALQDHTGAPHSLCRHPDERVHVDGRMATVFAVVMDLDERKMYLCDGPPCCNEPRDISL